MTLKTINISAGDAEDALVQLAGHVPASVPLGRPQVVRRDLDDSADPVVSILAVLDDAEPVMWYVSAAQAERQVPFTHRSGRELQEITCYAHGRERSRIVGPVR